MILKKVYVENFISHRSSKIEFDYGVNVITGPNGAGKTSILDAISFGLFNVHSRGRNENLIHRNADKSRITVEFNEGGVDYIVEWDIDRRRRQTRGILSRIQNSGKSIIARGGGQIITPEVEKTLGIDKHLFLQSIYIQQGEIERLITTTPADRKQIISKLLGIEDLEKAYQQMREIINEYQNTASRLDTELKRKPSIESRIQDLKLEIEYLEDSFIHERAKLKDIGEELKALENQLSELNQKRERFNELNMRKAILEVEIENLNKNLKRKERELEEAENAFIRVEALKEAIRKLPIIESYYSLLQKLNEKNREVVLEHQKLKHIENLINTLTSNENAYRNYQARIDLLSRKRMERKSYEGAREELTQLRKHYQENLKRQERKSKALLQLLKEYSIILGEEITYENMESILTKRRNELNLLRTELAVKADSLKEKIGSIKNQIEDIKFKLSKIAEADLCPICGRELTPQHKLRLQEEFKKVKLESEEMIGKLQDELKHVNAKEKEYEEMLEKLASINSKKIMEVISELKELDLEIAQEGSEIEILKRKVETLEGIDAEIEMLEKEVEELEEFYREYEAARRELNRWPTRESIEANLKVISEEVNTISREMENLIANLGYKPENPEQELADLRSRKEEFDRSKPLAERRNSLLKEVQDLKYELKMKKLELEEVLEEIEKLNYNEQSHKEMQRSFEGKEQEKDELAVKIAELETEIKTKHKEMESCENELKQLLEKEREKTIVEDFIRILERIRNAFHKDGLQRLVRARSKPLLE
ncbi:AAA family ATPase, partial [Candidatus Bathyarchaeota archaeon]|nr:AAA family ATPase [Candidatus Bathyarchaeota archaeon]